MCFHKTVRYTIAALTCLLVLVCSASAQNKNIQPVTPNASPEAKALLEYLQSIKGKYTLSGQHNFPISGNRNTQFAANYYGKTPIVWSQDFGFAKAGDKDSYLARAANVTEAIREYRSGAIVNLCWHAVPPTADEPVTFQPVPGSHPAHLASVQGHLTDKQFKELLTKGTALHKHWLEQVDRIASYLKLLQKAHVPVLWRPYHEMNGNWFWWGGHYKGKYTTAELYRQIFDRFVHYHKLNNLIWVWSVDRPTQPDREFSRFYPGNKYVDVLALDVYGSDFKQTYYDSLKALSKGKPITLAEVGVPPTLETLKKQPDWTWWVIWAGMVRDTPLQQYKTYTGSTRVLFMEDPAYKKGIEHLRTVSGLPSLPLSIPADFTGTWKLNKNASTMSTQAVSNTPYKLDIIQKDSTLAIKSTSVVEWANDKVTEQILALNGRDMKLKGLFNAPRIENAHWSAGKDTLTIDSKTTFTFGGNTRVMKSKAIWILQRRGNQLVINLTADSFRGEPGTSTIVYNKQ